MTETLTPARRRHRLERLIRSDYAGLPEFVVADINHPRSGGFGSLPFHHMLTRDQLDECLRPRPALKNETNFVNFYLNKLHPNPDLDWRNDPESYREYLDNLWDFVSPLAPVHNSLKVSVLYHLLTHQRSQGDYDADLFLT